MEVIEPYAGSVIGKLPPFNQNDVAYVIFTSGSSGKPKGVQVSHEAAQNTCREMVALLELTEQDVCFGLSALSFDLSVFDIFGPLSVGAKLVLCGARDTQNPHEWKSILQNHRVTIWNSVPKSFEMLIRYSQGGDLHWPRAVLLSGDWVPVKLAREVYRKCRLICLGGATEASIWSNFHEVVEEPHTDQSSIPYGRGLPNQQLMVLDEDLCQVPDGKVGEIYIGGLGLAKGYFKDPERTREVFLHSTMHGRLYKTGDFGRYLETGEIEFLGRRDFQIKRSGFRVELSQISTELEHLPWVASSVATHRDGGDGGCLTCWVELEASHWKSIKEQEARVRRLEVSKDSPEAATTFAPVPPDCLRFWRRRTYRVFHGECLLLDTLKEYLRNPYLQQIFRTGHAHQVGDPVDAKEVAPEVQGRLLELLSQQCIDGHYRGFAYASAGAARAVTTWLLKCVEGQWMRCKYINQFHGLEQWSKAEIDADLAKLLAANHFVVQCVADLSSSFLQKYGLPMRTVLMKQEMGCMKAVLDEAASQYGWEWRLCHSKCTEEVVECSFVLVQLHADTWTSAGSVTSVTACFLDFAHDYGACTDDRGVFVEVSKQGMVEDWQKLFGEMTPHNQVVAQNASCMLQLKVKPLGSPPQTQTAEVDVLVGKIAQLVMMIPTRCELPDTSHYVGWCPIYLGSASMLLVGGPISPQQWRSPQAFWSQDMACELLKSHLKSRLPQHFQPDKIILQKLPLSSNGKVDYSKLRNQDLDESKTVQEDMVGFFEECEEWLLKEIGADTECEGLRCCKVDDNFVRLGMRSLKMTKMAQAASQKFKIRLSAMDFFENPTVRMLTSLFEKRKKESMPAADSPCVEPVPVATAQPAQPMPLRVAAIALRLPGQCLDSREFWEALREGRDQVCPAPSQRISLGLLRRHAGWPAMDFASFWYPPKTSKRDKQLECKM